MTKTTHGDDDGAPSRFRQLQVLDAIRDRRDLDLATKAVLMMTVLFCDSRGRCHPAYATLAAAASVTRRRAIQAVNELERLGFIERELRSDPASGSNTSNRYRVRAEALLRTSPADPLVANEDHQGGERGSPGLANELHQGGERGSPGLANELHHPGDRIAPNLVKDDHHPGDPGSPKGAQVKEPTAEGAQRDARAAGQRERARELSPTPPLDAFPPGETVTPMLDDAELPPEWAAAVQMFGVRDVADVWLAFRAHHVATGKVTSERGWRALFVDAWCRRERKYQSKDLARGKRPIVQEDRGPRAWTAPTAEDFEPATGAPLVGVIMGGKR